MKRLIVEIDLHDAANPEEVWQSVHDLLQNGIAGLSEEDRRHIQNVRNTIETVKK